MPGPGPSRSAGSTQTGWAETAPPRPREGAAPACPAASSTFSACSRSEFHRAPGWVPTGRHPGNAQTRRRSPPAPTAEVSHVSNPRALAPLPSQSYLCFRRPSHSLLCWGGLQPADETARPEEMGWPSPFGQVHPPASFVTTENYAHAPASLSFQQVTYSKPKIS